MGLGRALPTTAPDRPTRPWRYRGDAVSAQDDLAMISKGYEAFGAGDIQTVMDLFTDDIAWHIPGKNPLAGDYHGKDQVMGFFGKLMEMTGGTFRLTIHDL